MQSFLKLSFTHRFFEARDEIDHHCSWKVQELSGKLAFTLDSIEIQKIINEGLKNLVFLFIQASSFLIVVIGISFFQSLDLLDLKLYHVENIFAYLNPELRCILEYSDLNSHDLINIVYDFVLEIALKDIGEETQDSFHGI